MTTLFPVSIRLHSVIEDTDEHGAPDGEPEISITTHDGSMRLDGDIIRLRCKENTEGGEVDTRITCYADGRISISRDGAIAGDILFSEEEPCACIYSIPPYRFDMTVKTQRIRSTMSEGGGDIALHYTMSIGGSDRRAKMFISVSPREKARKTNK